MSEHFLQQTLAAVPAHQVKEVFHLGRVTEAANRRTIAIMQSHGVINIERYYTQAGVKYVNRDWEGWPQ